MKNNQKGFSVVEALIILVVVGLLATVGWLVFSRQKDATSNKTQQAKANVETTNNSKQTPTQLQLQPEDVTAKIKQTYASRYTVVDTNQPKSGEISILQTKTSPAYKAKGYSFYTNYDGGSSLSLMVGPVNWGADSLPRAIDTAVRKEVASTYSSLGLTKQETRGNSSEGDTTDVYEGKGVVCTIETPSAPTSATYATCGLIEAYTKAAAQVKPLADVLPNVNESTVFLGLKVSDSKVAGYQKAEVGQHSIDSGGSSVALFYKKGTAAWTYFRNTQQALQCAEYNTADLRNAFKGDVCYDSTGQKSTVQ